MFPEAQDSSNGLIYASGHYLTHLAFFLTVSFIREAPPSEGCHLDHNLNEDIIYLKIMHGLCFLLMIAAEYSEMYYPNFHYSVYAYSVAVLVYLSIIYRS
jgi:hypothetical protein